MQASLEASPICWSAFVTPTQLHVKSKWLHQSKPEFRDLSIINHCDPREMMSSVGKWYYLSLPLHLLLLCPAAVSRQTRKKNAHNTHPSHRILEHRTKQCSSEVSLIHDVWCSSEQRQYWAAAPDVSHNGSLRFRWRGWIALQATAFRSMLHETMHLCINIIRLLHSKQEIALQTSPGSAPWTTPFQTCQVFYCFHRCLLWSYLP